MLYEDEMLVCLQPTAYRIFRSNLSSYTWHMMSFDRHELQQYMLSVHVSYFSFLYYVASWSGDWNRLHVPYLFLWFPRWVISTYLASNKHTPFIVNTTVKRVLELWSRQKWEPFYSYHSGKTLLEYKFCSYLTGNEPLFSLLFSYTTYAHSIKEFLQLIVCIYLEDALPCIYVYHVQPSRTK